jgi:hypothetical protein
MLNSYVWRLVISYPVLQKFHSREHSNCSSA